MKPLFFASLVGLVACGGSTSNDLFNDASTSDASSNDSSTNDSSSSDSSTSDASADARPDGADCTALLAAVDKARPEAIKCNPNLPVVTCDKHIDDMCCPLTVAAGDRPEIKTFEAAVKAAKGAGCVAPCPKIPCATQPTKKCDFNSATCVQF